MTIRIFSTTMALFAYLVIMSLFASGAFGEAETDTSAPPAARAAPVPAPVPDPAS